MPKTNVYKEPKPKPNLSVEKAIRTLENYFGNAKFKYRHSCYGLTIYFDICYFDFKPRRQVFQELTELIPNMEIETLRRELSPEAILTAYYHADERNETIYVRMPNGAMQPAHLTVLISDSVSNYSFLTDDDYTESVTEIADNWE